MTDWLTDCLVIIDLCQANGTPCRLVMIRLYFLKPANQHRFAPCSPGGVTGCLGDDFRSVWEAERNRSRRLSLPGQRHVSRRAKAKNNGVTYWQTQITCSEKTRHCPLPGDTTRQTSEVPDQLVHDVLAVARPYVAAKS